MVTTPDKRERVDLEDPEDDLSHLVDRLFNSDQWLLAFLTGDESCQVGPI